MRVIRSAAGAPNAQQAARTPLFAVRTASRCLLCFTRTCATAPCRTAYAAYAAFMLLRQRKVVAAGASMLKMATPRRLRSAAPRTRAQARRYASRAPVRAVTASVARQNDRRDITELRYVIALRGGEKRSGASSRVGSYAIGDQRAGSGHATCAFTATPRVRAARCERDSSISNMRAVTVAYGEQIARLRNII